MENGFAIIHANRLEDLTALTVDWIKGQPLPPLVDDVFLVESNGIAQWLRLALADDAACGIAAAQQFQMPFGAGRGTGAAHITVRQVPACLATDATAALAVR
jgi:exodeoxyribonuclease V gamma subunit